MMNVVLVVILVVAIGVSVWQGTMAGTVGYENEAYVGHIVAAAVAGLVAMMVPFVLMWRQQQDTFYFV